MLNDHTEGEWTQGGHGEWTQGGHGEWTQGGPETGWKTVEESAAILKAIFPNYPSLDPGKPYDGKGEQESETAVPATVV